MPPTWGTPPEVPQGKLAQAAAPSFDLAKTIGGPRGIIESVLPYTVFSIVYGPTSNLRWSIIAAAVPVVVLVVWRLIARETLQQVVSGALGIALGAWLAQRTGNAADFFLPSIFKNIGYGAAYAVSNLVRRPLVGVVIGPLTGEMFAWRQNRSRYSAYWWATWVWVGLFAVRLLVQVPLYFADQVTLLGTLNGLVLGIPLFALTIYLSWLILRNVPLARPQAPPVEHEQPGTAHQRF
jgi:uncharacterized protein DUF3159